MFKLIGNCGLKARWRRPLQSLGKRRVRELTRSRLLAGVKEETLSIAAMRVNNPGCSPRRIDG
jgi:hypothetical protein